MLRNCFVAEHEASLSSKRKGILDQLVQEADRTAANASQRQQRDGCYALERPAGPQYRHAVQVADPLPP